MWLLIAMTLDLILHSFLSTSTLGVFVGDIPLLMVVFWGMRHDDSWLVWLGFVAGLIMACITDQVLGFTSFIYSLAAIVTQHARPRLMVVSRVKQACFVVCICAGSLLLFNFTFRFLSNGLHLPLLRPLFGGFILWVLLDLALSQLAPLGRSVRLNR